MANDINPYENLRSYAWNYFQVHAAQRLTTFNFFVLISTVIVSGYSLAAREVPLLAMTLSIVLMLVAFIFWKLDTRTRQLIQNAENALKFIEKEDKIEGKQKTPHILNIFSYEETQTSELKAIRPLWPWMRLFTYRTCFTWIFAIFGVLGLIGFVFSLILCVAG